VTAAARRHLWLDPDLPALEIHHRDARVLLQSLPAVPAFDVVFGDAFHDISVPAHLVTREFHREIARRLTDRGFYVANAVDDGRRPRFVAALARTLATDFAAVEVWAEVEALSAATAGTESRITYVVVAGHRDSGIDRLPASRGIARFWLRLPVDGVLRVAGDDVPVLTDDFAPVDRLMATLLLAPEE
jgi:spermidine synthase